MIIFDAHLDLAWNALDWNRDLRQPVSAIRESEKDVPGKGRGVSTVAIPDMRRGKIAICIATLLARQLRGTGLAAVNRYTSMEAAYAAAYGQLAYYRALEQEGHFRWIRDWPSLEKHVRAWQTNEDASTEPIGFILSMEGADPVLHPEQVEEWWNAGLRIVGPAHYGPSPYAHGTGTEGGLFPPGKPLLKLMDKLGMILDVTHLADVAFDEALDIYTGPVLASHHNCRALVPNQRQLTDDNIKRLIQRGAVIGAALDSWMLYPGWIRGETKPEVVKLEAMLDHTDHICQIAGNAKHVAIGTDLDGGFGKEQTPCDLDTIADLQRLPDMLKKRGYSAADIEGFMYGNWLRFFREAWSK